MRATYPAWGIQSRNRKAWVEHEGQEYEVTYVVNPAEPDVGIPSPYIEITSINPEVPVAYEGIIEGKVYEYEDDRGNEP